MQISATIIARNEENSVARAISSLGFCDEIVVVDSGSTDRTVKISESLGAMVIHNDWLGYAAQKNFAARAATHDWILSIDADEEVSPRLAASIQRLREAGTRHVGFDFARKARYCGRWIEHSGWYPDRKVRLYRRDRGSWKGNFVHESVVVSGAVGHLDGDLLHYTCDTLEAHRANVERYTDLAAQEIRATGKKPPIWRVLLAPPYAFVKSYLLQLGLLDGAAGLTIARMAARYVYLKYSKARRLSSR
ncbi:MAG: glycosyltransferase family 2 protein [Bryobacterales bacterium]|nr:glycosyltransferase family 2 protein [Bryobacterales bacterium]